MSKRRLIEDWLPIAEIGIESVRERAPMIPYPAPNRLHLWFARRPLVASRAAVLGSLVSDESDRPWFQHMLGIHGNPMEARVRIADATRRGVRLGADAYGYRRAFNFVPPPLQSVPPPKVLDPTAGGGSIPFEAIRLGCSVIANDLNPVASFTLRATVEWPALYGASLLHRVRELGAVFTGRVNQQIAELFPQEPNGCFSDAYIWARTITCPYCGGLVPLSPNWRLSAGGIGVRLDAEMTTRRMSFSIVEGEGQHAKGTAKGGNGICPFPDCRRTIDDEEIKKQGRGGQMGHQLYCVVYKEQKVKGYTKKGKPKYETLTGFRSPRPEDDVDNLVRERLAVRMPGWRARDIVPDEEFPKETNDDRPIQYGMPLWRDMFSPRQLFAHCASVEVFHEMVEELITTEMDRAAMAYLAIAISKMADWNSYNCIWDTKKFAMNHTFSRHDFAFRSQYCEMAPTTPGNGYDWAVGQVGNVLEELLVLLGHSTHGDSLFAGAAKTFPDICILNESADRLPIPDDSVDCVVMDPPYYDNVMYAELSDFLYVWLKRTAGRLYPDLFTSHLTDKDREAVANAARFAGQKGGAKNLAGRDYQRRMAAIFKEQRRVLKPSGIMTVMFTHKAAGAWDALAGGLIEAGFTITASWPVNTEAEGSLHIREKSAARSTIFLVCRVRETAPTNAEPRYWEEVEPTVRQAVRAKVREFQEAGIGGIDLYLACFGPALQVFTEAWPLARGTARPQPKTKQRDLFEDFDPYAVRPEDALEAARREVKQWRMEQLATVKRQHHLDALTEWYVLAWDAFRAPRFPADEALKLARVVGLDFDQDVRKQVCEVKGDDVILWDSVTRYRNGSLRHVSEECMLDTLHWAAKTAREQNTGAARSLIDEAHLIGDPTLLTALEALLNVLPPGVALAGRKKPDAHLTGAANDFEALERLRKLAFSETVPAPKIPEQLPLELPATVEDEDESAD
jgi:adenine-specific DNA methylase